MSYQPTSVPVGSRREQERARRRRKKEWMTKAPLDIRAFYRDTLGVQGEDVIELFAKHTSFIYRNKGEVFIHSGEPVTTGRHSQLTEEELNDQDIHQSTIRLSIGTEHIDDIIADLEQGFAAIQPKEEAAPAKKGFFKRH